LFLDPERLLHGELVVGRNDPGDARRLDRPGVGGELHLRRRVGHLFDGHENLHALAPLRSMSYESSRVIRNRSPGMKTRSKTTGTPRPSKEMRSDWNAALPVRASSPCASRRGRRTADTISCARVTTMPSLNSRICASGVSARSARITSSPRCAG